MLCRVQYTLHHSKYASNVQDKLSEELVIGAGCVAVLWQLNNGTYRLCVVCCQRDRMFLWLSCSY